jgi:hypothetical protein
MIGVEMSRLKTEFFNAGYELGINNFQFPEQPMKPWRS